MRPSAAGLVNGPWSEATDTTSALPVNGSSPCSSFLMAPATNVQIAAQHLKFQLNLYALKESRQIKSFTFTSTVANLLHEKWFGPYYTEPVIAGLDLKILKPFISSLDLIGCLMVTDDFVVSGTR
ncbi:hypothetical protein U0070_024487 [Myodes glareolus]|uniref:Uncharacterized protein n=1 Tax=Myodes glareolus TaxID=447135 RepID=A0AAW0ITF0_MYOGA